MQEEYQIALLHHEVESEMMTGVVHKYKKLFMEDILSKTIELENVYQCQCGSMKLEQLTKIDRFGLPFGSLLCRTCGLMITSPRLKQESLPYYYSKYYHPLIYGKESLVERKSLFVAGQGNKIFNKINKFLPVENRLDILEIGSGTGSVLLEFKQEAFANGIHVDEMGTEYSDECVVLCQDKGLNVVSKSLEDITKEKKLYDVVILSHVFEHFIDLIQELKNVRGILKEDGVVYIEVPGILTLHKNTHYNASFIKYLIHAHMYNFSLDSLHSLCARNGFTMLDGNEQVEAVFRKGKEAFSLNGYNKVHKYLAWLHVNKDTAVLNLQKDTSMPILSQSMEDELFIYIDPGYTSGIGHYRNFAEKIHRYAKNNGLKIQHYVNKHILFEDKKRFNLEAVFNFNARIDEESMSYFEINRRLDDFKKNVEIIFFKLKQEEKNYKKIRIYMYTCHCLHIDLLTRLHEEFEFLSVELHLVILQLNPSVVNDEKNKAVQECLMRNGAKDSVDQYIYMDSSRAAGIYQKFFKKKLSSLPIPLHHQKELKVTRKEKQNKIKTIAFFGYAEYKYGFHLFYEMYQYFSTRFKYTVRLNNKIHNVEFNDKIKVLKQDKNVLFVDHYIDELSYTTLIQESDIVIIPYLQRFYPVQTSGVFIDALWNDVFIIAADNTWMADMIRDTECGLVFKDNEPESLKCTVLLAEKICMANNNKLNDKYRSFFTVEKMFEVIRGNKMNKNEKPNHEAYDEKDFMAIEARKKDYDNFMSFFRKSPLSEKQVHSFTHVLYPAIDNLDILEDLQNSLMFALPETDNISIKIPLSDVIDINKVQKYNSISYIHEKDIERTLEGSVVLIHNMSSVENFHIFKDTLRVEIIDKEYFSDVEAETLRKLFYKTISPERKREYSEVSKANFIRFRKKNIRKKEAFCFTTGPSFDNYKEFDFSKNSLKIICNSIVKNNEFIDYIGGVDLITFGDPVFHFGPSSYAKNFREDVIKLVKKSEAYIIIPEVNVPLMLHHYPELYDKLIGLGGGEKFNFPNTDNFYIKNTANILTLMMIPLASTIADTIFIMGADGRKEDEKYFWKHSKSAQYNGNMEDAFKAHPSFFRDRDYKDYYQEHCQILNNLISYGESLGKVYVSMTKSYIPVLKKNWIDFNKGDENVFFEIEERRDKNRSNSKGEANLNSNSTQSVNYDFALKMNVLYGYIDKLKESNTKIALYGNGLVGQMIAREIKEQLVVVVDQNRGNGFTEFGPLCLPNEIKNYDFDILVITVLGREKNIIDNIDVDINKIYVIDIRDNALKSFRVVSIDKGTDAFLENNLCGPYTRESQLSLDETHIVSEYLDQEKGVMIDVGAHIGSSSKLFLDSNWKVYGYEPDPKNREKLRNNLKKYEKLVISDKAISNEIGNSIDFYSSNESTGISSLMPFSEGHEKLCTVKTTTLEVELQNQAISEIDFLKIDTEGYDLMVLKGFPWTKKKPLVIECEYEDFKTNQIGYCVYDTIEFLVDKGYFVYVSEWHPIVRYGIRHEWKRLFQYSNQVIDPEGWGNLIAFLYKPDEEELVRIIRRQLELDS